MGAEIVNVREIVSYSAVAKELTEGASLVIEMMRRGLQSGSISVEQANKLRQVAHAMRLAAPLLRRPKVARATQQKRASGRETRQRVLAFAEKMKAREPGLSKSEAARRIARHPPAPYGIEQAKKYIDKKWKRAAWAQLGSVAR